MQGDLHFLCPFVSGHLALLVLEYRSTPYQHILVPSVGGTMHLYINAEETPDLLTEALEQLIRQTIKKTLESDDFEEDVEVSLTCVTPENMRTLNAQHRQKDTVTDVLSFPQYDEDGFMVDEDNQVVLGDVVICLERAKMQALSFGHPYEREVCYLVCHSILHLLGYDHESQKDKADMRAKEKKIMSTMGMSNIVEASE